MGPVKKIFSNILQREQEERINKKKESKRIIKKKAFSINLRIQPHLHLLLLFLSSPISH
jgi:hypothetical protein